MAMRILLVKLWHFDVKKQSMGKNGNHVNTTAFNPTFTATWKNPRHVRKNCHRGQQLLETLLKHVRMSMASLECRYFISNVPWWSGGRRPQGILLSTSARRFEDLMLAVSHLVNRPSKIHVPHIYMLNLPNGPRSLPAPCFRPCLDALARRSGGKRCECQQPSLGH